MEERYYVQHLAEGVFLIRERTSPDGKPGPDDRIIRSFEVRHDAYMFANTMNEKQKQPNDQVDTGSRQQDGVRHGSD